jgi:hypothetical protein
MKFKWEIIFESESEMNFITTSRAKVPGGWLIVNRTAIIGSKNYTESQSMIFLPDPGHLWKIDS